MCGIAGYIGARPTAPQKELLKSMISQLRHRGPDGLGYYMCNLAGLAHARLSIIDVEGGAQPLCNEDGTVWVTFNGEIYNYRELRKVLESQGHVFRTNTDTEVIVHAYEEYGIACVNAFNGQFAMAIWDANLLIGYLVRDRVGIHPLYYTKVVEESGEPPVVYFGSEVKSLFANPKVNRDLNRQELGNVFTYWSPRPGHTVFNNILEVEPGQVVTVHANTGSPSPCTYWDHDYHKREQSFDLAYHMGNAVEFRQTRSDVPVGAYLSGGLDSSVIVQLARNLKPDLQTFSISFEEKQYDEGEFQRQMAANTDICHTEFKCRKTDIARVMPDVIWHAEKPLFRTAPAPMYLLSKMVRDAGIKVVLTGEGADEVFAGYDIFRENYVRRKMALSDADPALIGRLLHDLYPWMSDRMMTSSTDYLKVFFGGGSSFPSHPWFSHEMRFALAKKASLFFKQLSPHRPVDYFDDMRSTLSQIEEDLDRAQYIEFKTLFQGYLMSTQGDRMLMANGVEGRFPFLDPNVVDYGNALPPSEKLRVDKVGRMHEKHVVKKLAEKLIVPNSIINRKKQPYMAPDAESFFSRPEGWEYVEHAFNLDYGYFNMKKAAILYKKAAAGKLVGFPENLAFMGILSTQMLHTLMVENFMPQPTYAEDCFNVREERFFK